MRGLLTCAIAGLILTTAPTKAAVYLFNDSATIMGPISGTVSVDVKPVLIDAGAAASPDAFFVTGQQIVSLGINGDVFDISSNFVEVDDFATGTYDPSGQTSYPGQFRFVSGASVLISDSARLVTYGGGLGFSAGFGGLAGSYYFEIILPDGLSVAGERPLTAAVPELSTWVMMLLGFAMIGIASTAVTSRCVE